MKSSLIRPLIMGVFAFPLFVAGQQAGIPGSGPALPGSQVRQDQVIAAPPVPVPGEPGSAETPKYSDPDSNFFSNVPINELSPRAYRRFHRRFPDARSGEHWFKSTDGYQVSFVQKGHHELAYYDPDGGFKYSIRYYEGKDFPRDAGDVVERRFPDYRINVATEVNDGQKTFYIVQIVNPLFVKVLSIVDGRVDIINELNNGGSGIGPAEARR